VKVFISYRRSDCQDMAARIADHLGDAPGIDEVFIDVEDIAPGVDFTVAIDAALAESDVSLVLIGDGWLGSRDGQGPARILDDGDFVRAEVAASLASGRKVIPVLLNNAPMPDGDALPEDVRPVVNRNAVFVRHLSFDQDIELLLDAVSGRQRGRPRRWLRRHPLIARALAALAGMAASAAALVGLAAIHSQATDGAALEHTLGGKGMVWLLIIAALAAGAVTPLWYLRRR
jgi:hypothetical protein